MRLKVLSLFDGMSCGRIALDNLGIPVQYYSSEIDQFAIAESKAHWGDIIRLGDITYWQQWDVPWSEIDLVIGGSPCQGLSIAGKHLGFDDSRSKLFYTYATVVKVLKVLNPDVKFLLENVKMKQSDLDIVTGVMGVEPVFINSAEVTAQNRQRYYWYNWDVPTIQSKDIKLQDVLDDDEYYADRDKAYCIDANYFKGSNLKSYAKGRRQIVFNKRNPDVFRKLSVQECCRLQGVPDDHFKVSSDTQAYKQLGNGWTIPVIEHLFTYFK